MVITEDTITKVIEDLDPLKKGETSNIILKTASMMIKDTPESSVQIRKRTALIRKLIRLEKMMCKKSKSQL